MQKNSGGYVHPCSSEQGDIRFPLWSLHINCTRFLVAACAVVSKMTDQYMILSLLFHMKCTGIMWAARCIISKQICWHANSEKEAILLNILLCIVSSWMVCWHEASSLRQKQLLKELLRVMVWLLAQMSQRRRFLSCELKELLRVMVRLLAQLSQKWRLLSCELKEVLRVKLRLPQADLHSDFAQNDMTASVCGIPHKALRSHESWGVHSLNRRCIMAASGWTEQRLGTW